MQDGSKSCLAVDHLIAGPGYRLSLEQPPFLEAQLLEHLQHIEGSPVLNRQFESSWKRLLAWYPRTCPSSWPLPAGRDHGIHAASPAPHLSLCRRYVERHSIDTEAGKLAESFRLTYARS
jgi:hypothetical protein